MGFTRDFCKVVPPLCEVINSHLPRTHARSCTPNDFTCISTMKMVYIFADVLKHRIYFIIWLKVTVVWIQYQSIWVNNWQAIAWAHHEAAHWRINGHICGYHQKLTLFFSATKKQFLRTSYTNAHIWYRVVSRMSYTQIVIYYWSYIIMYHPLCYSRPKPITVI